ncbi:MAG: HAD family hydrolase [Spirochaetales bacterium]|nr:HAD family hydrolase [Spirochaetales bacterium]
MKAVIFDMDGVLVNSEPHHFAIEKEIFASLGFSLDESELKTYVGMSLVKFWTGMKERFSLRQSIEELIENDSRVRISYFEALDHLDPIDGIRELLSGLAAAGIKIALASSSHRAMIDIVLKKLGLGRYFVFIISGHEIEHGKPAPDIFLKSAEAMGLEPVDCLVIEDSRNGVKAANAAGMPCVGFRNPDSGDQDLTTAQLVIDSFSGIDAELLEKVK